MGSWVPRFVGLWVRGGAFNANYLANVANKQTHQYSQQTNTANRPIHQHTNTKQIGHLFNSRSYERDLQAEYVLGMYLSAAYIGGVLLLGWSIVSSYMVGYTVPD